jgi:hypothetical protein
MFERKAKYKYLTGFGNEEVMLCKSGDEPFSFYRKFAKLSDK